MSVCVLCVGNPIARDDGLGIRVARILADATLPPGVTIEERPNLGLDLVDLLRSHDRLVIVDAMSTGAQPGACRVLDASQAADLASVPYCCHAIGLAELLRIAARLDPEAAAHRVLLVGVEAAVLHEFGTALSPPVRQALPEAVAVVLRLVGAEPGAVAAAVDKAGGAPDPDISDLLLAPSPHSPPDRA
jgi:hydrogenase maturation protease